MDVGEQDKITKLLDPESKNCLEMILTIAM
jgi:hypothetical protein